MWLFMGRVGENADCEPVSSAVVYIVAQINVARDAFRAATAISQHMTSVKLNLSGTIVCD